ncbi:HlyD family efflux transporter periplasmic adaptor subunit [Acidaminobacter sp. JC074]|uniref:efflux RND transporter periplasmic adaptor subunit n=1 Tax=Acidaminobacter sp. JC074 TaxID=2530199 RepID=UPI001F0E79D5|nr:efflux RND transporter periplasmic adaptor subunit [Acidaminobacter sp. JC074]MCH4889259.1 HlyD family efflux transporter periplasmic adaptor subunit [Acidaminobacter sp. JC074]
MKKRKIFLIIVVIAILAMIGLGFAFGNKEDVSTTYVTTGIAKSEDLTAYVNTNGMITAKSSYIVYPKATGEVTAIHVKEGDKVTKGQVLLELDKSGIEKQITETEIQLEIAKESLLQIINRGSNNYKTSYKNAVLARDDAKKAYDDALALYEAGVSTKTSKDAAYSAYQQALNAFEETRSNYNNENSDSEIKIQELRIQSLENTIADLNEQLEDTYVKSPIDGFITTEDVKLLSIVGMTTPLFTVEDLDNLIVNINVSQYDIHKLQLGQKVTIKANGLEDETFEGLVSKIGSKALAKVVGASQEMVIEVEIDVTSKETPLKPNYSVKAEIETAHVESALVLPYESVYVNKDDELVVFTVTEGSVKKHIIERGVEGIFNFQAISDSIQAGDHVILNPNEEISEEIAVFEMEVKE